MKEVVLVLVFTLFCGVWLDPRSPFPYPGASQSPGAEGDIRASSHPAPRARLTGRNHADPMMHAIRNLLQSPFSVAGALWGLLLAVRAIVEPFSIASGFVLPYPILIMWAGMLAVGAITKLIGHAMWKAKLAAMGCVLFAGGCLLYVMAVLVFPYSLGGYWIAIAPILFAGAAIQRLRLLLSGQAFIRIADKEDAARIALQNQLAD